MRHETTATRNKKACMLTVLVCTVLALMFFSACSSKKTVGNATRDFEKNFVAVIQDAGVDVTSVSFCAHQLSSPGPTTLYAFTRFEAPPETVADILRDQGMVTSGLPPYITVQQHPGQPQRGWYGGIRPDEAVGFQLTMSQHGHKQIEAGTIEKCKWSTCRTLVGGPPTVGAVGADGAGVGGVYGEEFIVCG